MEELDERFEFWFRVYMNDVHIAEAYCFSPESYSYIDPKELRWEIQLAWTHLEELIPQSHLDAVACL